jgi:hypothetical protein
MVVVDVDPSLGCLHCVNMGSVADVSEEHTLSVFMVELVEGLSVSVSNIFVPTEICTVIQNFILQYKFV